MVTALGKTSLSFTAIKSMVLTSVVLLAPPAQAQGDFVFDGKAGFVVSHIEYALSHDAEETGACPDGMSLNIEEIYKMTPEGQRREGESDQEYTQRLFGGAFAFGRGPNGEDMCMNPEAGSPDPHFRSAEVPDTQVYGINIDGHVSTMDNPAPGSCPHNDLVGMNGERGIDNQFFRAVGCIHAYQPTGSAPGFVIEMLTGAWSILITLSDVDDIHNDDYVEVGFYANADPIQITGNHEPLEWATYAVDQDPRFQARARGRIVDGVLTTDPVDVRFRKVTNSILLERPLRDAVARMTLSEDGTLEGYLAGYADVEEIYDSEFAFRNGLDGIERDGRPANPRLISISAGGKARTLGYTCNGIYHALWEHADGHPDPETGQCTSISTQYRIKAIPAFVVDEPEIQVSVAE